MIIVNGTPLKAPSDYSVGIVPVRNISRNANGFAIIEEIAKKRKVDITWSYLTSSELNTIQGLLYGVSAFFTLAYVDLDGTTQTGTFFAGDIFAPVKDYKDSVARFKDVSVTLEER